MGKGLDLAVKRPEQWFSTYLSWWAACAAHKGLPGPQVENHTAPHLTPPPKLLCSAPSTQGMGQGHPDPTMWGRAAASCPDPEPHCARPGSSPELAVVGQLGVWTLSCCARQQPAAQTQRRRMGGSPGPRSRSPLRAGQPGELGHSCVLIVPHAGRGPHIGNRWTRPFSLLPINGNVRETQWKYRL